MKEKFSNSGQDLKKIEIASLLQDIEDNIEEYKMYFPNVVKDEPDPFMTSQPKHGDFYIIDKTNCLRWKKDQHQY